MTKKAEQIVTDALALAPEIRAFVAEKLIESLDTEPQAILSPEWQEEIKNRCREVDDSSIKLREAEAVFKKAFASLT